MIYRYPPLLPGVLVKRYKRFFADIALADGTVVTAHCPNTGPMTEISTVGSAVYISEANSPARKLAYTWEMIQVDGSWVGVNTHLPNRVVALGLADHQFADLPSYTRFQPEVPYGSEQSRIDFLLHSERPLYLEVKSTTWTQPTPEGRRAIFPDTVTTRGQKHLRELTALAEQGLGAAILYFINRGDCVSFSPGDGPDPEYGRLLRRAVAAGVLVLPYRFMVSPLGLTLGERVPVVL
ncbi:DNA/RNA nuclease SfsA [Candidatus Cyanaurora vandensis]|uniref:DNA/RNA nuclease SfsA n=1 Tax=Candidatus Cyanaurora vandensis TaxID=2714958 RepID=UPI002579514E|nr:DNA/RNA nuclease SfsA [Candidatus Cyanaurora vandensis]